MRISSENLKHYIAHRFKTVTSSEISGTLITLFVLGVIMVLSTYITPYRASVQFDVRQSDSTEYVRAEVVSMLDNRLIATLVDGPYSGEQVYVNNYVLEEPSADKGDTIIVSRDRSDKQYYYLDDFRLPGLFIALSIFIGIVLFIGGRRGATSLVGLAVSIIVVGWFILPLILTGYSALWVSIAGAYIIALVSILVAHGWRRRTFISIACVAFILMIVAIMSFIAINALNLTGLTDDATEYLLRNRPDINISGILIGGIVIASLGVLDDIVTAQVATVDELRKANSTLTTKELFTRASSVGHEHIASLVNTLVLVYVGAALPTIITLAGNTDNLVLLLNGEYVATEIIRTLIASSGLVLAVPISTIVAAVLLRR